jgi:hypothetical protein
VISAAQFILTRFSVKFGPAGGHLSEDWLRYRLGLFEEYCLPSLKRQTMADFHWLLLCDESTPSPFVDELNGLLSELESAVVVPTSDTRDWRAALVEMAPAGADLIVTSRVDSDDGLAHDFAERVRGYIEPIGRLREPSFLVNFTRGTKLDASRGRYFESFQPNGPFLTLFERPAPDELPITSLGGNHGHMYLDHPTHLDVGASYWLQVVHGTNVSNHLRPADRPIDPKSVRDRFAIPEEATEAR